MLDIGQEAPAFTLPDQHGDAVSLAGLLAAGPLLLYFYPADFTPLCTREACALRDRHDALSRTDVRLVGISPQSIDSHRRFSTEHALPFPLLFDDGKHVIRAFGVDGPLGLGVRRVTFLIETDGRIAARVVSDLRIGRHAELIDNVIALRGAPP